MLALQGFMTVMFGNTMAYRIAPGLMRLVLPTEARNREIPDHSLIRIERKARPVESFPNNVATS